MIMLNEKMKTVGNSIAAVITHSFPYEYLQFVFGGRITLDDIVNQVLFECCKFAYDQTADKHSLSYYIQREQLVGDIDAERMLNQRKRSSKTENF